MTLEDARELASLAREARQDALRLTTGNLSIFNPRSEAARLSDFAADACRNLRIAFHFSLANSIYE